MIQRLALTLILLFSTSAMFAQQKCNCVENFKWVKETFEQNDAGFKYALQQKGEEAYQRHNAIILAKIKKADSKETCADIMREWLSFFRKGHLSIAPVYNDALTDKTANSWPSFNISEAKIKQQVADNNKAFEGIWRTESDTIGIIKKEEGYKGVILASSRNDWKPGYVKLSINSDSSGVFYWGNFSPDKFTNATLIGKNILKLGYNYLIRLYPKFTDNDTNLLFAKEMTTNLPFVQKLSDKTVLFRIPTFNGTAKKVIDNLITENDTLLKSTTNLIIDIRGNGGGSDMSYARIIPLLYTNPIRSIGVEFYSTKRNNQRMLDLYNYSGKYGFSKDEKQWFKKSYDTLEKHLDEFVNLDSGKVVSIESLDTIFPLPNNVGIIIDGANGSTAEQFLLAARQSKKVKLFGVTTTGVLDISNMYFVISPDKQFRLGYSLSKSYRIPDMAIDGKGITPDYYIDKSIPDTSWLSFVQKILEN